MPVECNLLN